MVLGHKLPRGYDNDVPYLRITNIVTDGINRQHARLEVECERCGEMYHVANTHLVSVEEFLAKVKCERAKSCTTTTR